MTTLSAYTDAQSPAQGYVGFVNISADGHGGVVFTVRNRAESDDLKHVSHTIPASDAEALLESALANLRALKPQS